MMPTIEEGAIVRIGKGSSEWEVYSTRIPEAVVLLAVTRRIGGGYERSRYMPGRQLRRVESISRLVLVEG